MTTSPLSLIILIASIFLIGLLLAAQHPTSSLSCIKGNDVVEACLAVDALYFKPDIKITIDNCIKGSAFTQSLQDLLPENSFNYFTQNPQSLHNFILLNYDKIIKAGFVYHIQPYNIKYNSFVVHIKPTPNGKRKYY